MLVVAVFLFAYSSMITFSYYGSRALAFIFGHHDWLDMGFKVVFCLCAIVGASMSLGRLIDLADAMILSMAIPNIVGLYILAPEVKRELRDYIDRYLKPELEGQ